MLLAAVGGCAVTTEPLDQEAMEGQAARDLEVILGGQQPVTAPISLHEAMARAVRYNLESRLKVMESALAQRQLEVSSYEMLPKLTGSTEQNERSNESASTSRASKTPSVSADTGHTVASLTTVWNVLDFGVSYYGARQQANRAHIAEERRRKAAQGIIQDVRVAYWRA